jgi:peptidoglycan-associated lipoprotein
MQTVSYGKERPVCSESNDACWSRNRRVHFVITGRR